MIRRARLFSGAFVGVGLLVASQALLGSTSSSPATSSTATSSTTPAPAAETSCAAMKRWAEAYRDTNPTLEELATFDRAHRVAIFNAVTPEVRSALWRAQLTRFAQRPDLTPTQRALIAEGATLMTPALYDREPSASMAFKAFWARAEGEFTSSAQKLAWLDLGTVATPNHAMSSAQRVPQFSHPDGRSNCTCATTADTCGTKTCVAGGCTAWQGCGVGGQDICNGKCQ